MDEAVCPLEAAADGVAAAPDEPKPAASEKARPKAVDADDGPVAVVGVAVVVVAAGVS